METRYLLIPENTINAYKISEEHTLNPSEMAKIVVHRELIMKFIQQKAIALQFDIWTWKKKWEEELYLKVVNVLAEIAEEVWKSKEVFEWYIIQKRKEEEEEKKKAEEKSKK